MYYACSIIWKGKKYSNISEKFLLLKLFLQNDKIQQVNMDNGIKLTHYEANL